MLGRTRGTLSELLRHGSTDETVRLRKVLRIHGSEDKRCTCGEGWTKPGGTCTCVWSAATLTKDAAEMVERVASSSSSIFHRPDTLPNVCLKVPRLRAPPITQHAPLTVHVSLSIPWQGDTLAAASRCRFAAAQARAPDGGQPLVVRCARLRRQGP